MACDDSVFTCAKKAKSKTKVNKYFLWLAAVREKLWLTDLHTCQNVIEMRIIAIGCKVQIIFTHRWSVMCSLSPWPSLSLYLWHMQHGTSCVEGLTGWGGWGWWGRVYICVCVCLGGGAGWHARGCCESDPRHIPSWPHVRFWGQLIPSLSVVLICLSVRHFE